MAIVRDVFNPNQTATLEGSVKGVLTSDGALKTMVMSSGVGTLSIDALIDGQTMVIYIDIGENPIDTDALAVLVSNALDFIAMFNSVSISTGASYYYTTITPSTETTMRFDDSLLAATITVITVEELDKILKSFLNNQYPYNIIADPLGLVDYIIVTFDGVDYTVTGDTVEDMVQDIDVLLGLAEHLKVRCGVRGTVRQACADTEVTLHDKACAVLQNNDPADVVANCPALASANTPGSSDDKDAHYSIFVPNGQYFLVATGPMLDPMGLPVQSSHPTVNIPEDTFANVIMHVKPDGKNQAMKSGKKLGSVLWVYEPTDVVWVDAIEYYPFFFESDSDWTVDVCLEVPEGYAIIEGEECLQSFVANEERTIMFKVEEVGSIPYGFKSKTKFRNPAGKMTVEKSCIGVRLHPHLSL
ncbi:MAG: hypothetical protein KAJ19_08655, partial [Gammaproteobacteria bacterium]|nr:hypothetical protein [Gammaproteobacteria bacterium]